MEIFRYNSNAWGQRTLEGISWDLLWIFFIAGAVFIVLHALYMWLLAPGKKIIE